MESYSRVRSVKLRRHSSDAPFGFSVRGGHEHGTGIFVSFVDPRSTAFRMGLKVGDQILRVNGFAVSAAVHHEVLSLMRLRPALHLKVRSVGMLPVKERTGDPLTWKLVEEQPSLISTDGEGSRGHSRLSDTSSQPDSHLQPTEAKVFIDMTGQEGLGCCICKGPPERPGIFVQSTKSNGVAREAGLRPGDQLLACNGTAFLNTPFAEAVHCLKSTQQLRLRVLKGAAVDLFPGESSGYNSSASSLNGDHGAAMDDHPSPSPSPRSRLTSVIEEKDQGHPSSVALDQGMEWDEVEQVWRSAEKETIVIEVKGHDTNYRSEEQRLVEERKKLEETQKRLLQEAIRLDEEKRKFEEEKRKAHIQLPPPVVSNEGEISLAGALSQEILKRTERRESTQGNKEDEKPKPGTVEQKRSIFSGQIDQEKRQQHEQLIEEFKRAHKKMFAHSIEEASKEAESGTAGEIEWRNRRVQKELDHERQMVANRVAGIVRQRQLRIERQYQECEETEREIRTKSPPPPPPMPTSSFPSQNQQRAPVHFKKKAPPAPPAAAIAQMAQAKPVIIEEKGSSSSSPVKQKAPPPPPPQRAEVKNPPARPESPSPDYSNSPSPLPSPPRATRGKTGKNGVDMKSLESYRLKNPPESCKNPPPIYFEAGRGAGILKTSNGSGNTVSFLGKY